MLLKNYLTISSFVDKKQCLECLALVTKRHLCKKNRKISRLTIFYIPLCVRFALLLLVYCILFKVITNRFFNNVQIGLIYFQHSQKMCTQVEFLVKRVQEQQRKKIYLVRRFFRQAQIKINQREYTLHRLFLFH